jgi:hypothetical protein
VDTLDDISVRVATEELHQRAALDRDLQGRAVSVEIEERRHEVDPYRRVGLRPDPIKGRGEDIGADKRCADHPKPACGAHCGNEFHVQTAEGCLLNRDLTADKFRETGVHTVFSMPGQDGLLGLHLLLL